MDFIKGRAVFVEDDTAIIRVDRGNSTNVGTGCETGDAGEGIGYRVELCGLKIKGEESFCPVFSSFLHTTQNMRTGEVTRYAIKRDDDCIRLFWNLRKSRHAPSPRLSATLVNILGCNTIISALASGDEPSFTQAIKDAGIKGMGPKVVKALLDCPKLRKMATGIVPSSKPAPEVEALIRRLKDMGQPLPTTTEIRRLNSMAGLEGGQNLLFGIIRAGSVSKFLTNDRKPQDS